MDSVYHDGNVAERVYRVVYTYPVFVFNLWIVWYICALKVVCVAFDSFLRVSHSFGILWAVDIASKKVSDF